ncbi:MAG: pyrroline-5-carboxylate reductase [Clostridia bacterium]|nr:pyrroline-5-carboxylate reductase [Clostridia bacterium]
MKIGFIGAGNLANALVAGSSQSDFFSKNEFLAYDLFQPSLDKISAFGVTAVSSVTELIVLSDIVILAVKPKDFLSLLTENSETFKTKNPFIVSVAAGTELSFVRSCLGFNAKLARIMPNINAKVRGSATAVCVQENVSAEEKKNLIEFCNSFGGTFEMDESQFAVFGVIGGCSPAFNYMYIDQLARAAVKLGMNKSVALEVAAQAVKGSADMILSTDDHPYELVDRVCSPGGTTIEGVTALQQNGFENAVNAAVEASYNKDCKMRAKNN